MHHNASPSISVRRLEWRAPEILHAQVAGTSVTTELYNQETSGLWTDGMLGTGT